MARTWRASALSWCTLVGSLSDDPIKTQPLFMILKGKRRPREPVRAELQIQKKRRWWCWSATPSRYIWLIDFRCRYLRRRCGDVEWPRKGRARGALLVAQIHNFSQHPVRIKTKNKLWLQEAKDPYTKILQACCWTSRISGYVIMTLRSLSSYFSNNSYLEYLATGSNRDTEDCPSQRVLQYILHVPGFGYD